MLRPLPLYAAFFLAGAAAFPPTPPSAALPQATRAPQATPVPSTDVQKPVITQYREQRSAEILAGMEGTWRLNQFIHNSNGVDQGTVVGYATFHDGFGAILLHALDYEDTIQPEPLFQSTMFHYRLDSRLRLQTATLVGHSNFSGELIFEDNWTPREFNADMVGDSLILTRPDGARLQFLKLSTSAFPERALDLMREARGQATLGDDRNF